MIVEYSPGIDNAGCDATICAPHGVWHLSATGSSLTSPVPASGVSTGVTVVAVCMRTLETTTCATDAPTLALGTVSVVAPALTSG